MTSLSRFTFMHWGRKWQPTPVFLPGEPQGQGSPVGCHLWGHTELDTTEATEQQQQQLASSFYGKKRKEMLSGAHLGDLLRVLNPEGSVIRKNTSDHILDHIFYFNLHILLLLLQECCI